jgi:hypothetical protein
VQRRNKQRKDEVLLNVENVALGTTTKQRWNTKDKWIWSEHPVHDALASVEDYQRVQDILAKRAHGQYSQRPRPTRRRYALRGVLFCGYCERRMQGNWNNQQAYYRCRLPAQDANAGVHHPKIVYLREAEILGEVDGWLATAFAPDALERTIAAMTEQATDPNETTQLDPRKPLTTCDRQLIQYRSALDAGGDSIETSSRINEPKNASDCREEKLKPVPAGQPASLAEIRSVIEEIANVVSLVAEADPSDKAELYTRLGLKLTYYPDKHHVEARVEPRPSPVQSVITRARLTALLRLNA